MARTSVGSTQRSKVRIFFVEADVGPGDMQELTAALTSAIRPAPVVRAALPARVASSNGHAAETEQLELDADALESTAPDETEQPVGARTKSGPRNYRKPQAVEVDLTTGSVSWEDFAKQKASPDAAHRTKYLVAAAWLHDNAKIETITADHVFTCYQAADWNFDIGDTTVTFRALKKEGRGTLQRGNFSINHLGLSEVKKMKAE